MSAQHKQPSTHMAGSQLFTERPTIAQTALVILILLASLYAGSVHASGQHLLWYDRPAQNWNEALPIGNGRLGAMVYGNVAADRLQLNEETIWAGQPNNNANPEAYSHAVYSSLHTAGESESSDQSAGQPASAESE